MRRLHRRRPIRDKKVIMAGGTATSLSSGHTSVRRERPRQTQPRADRRRHRRIGVRVDVYRSSARNQVHSDRDLLFANLPSAAGMLMGMQFELGPDHRGNDRRVLSVTVEGQPAGDVDLGLADAEDEDGPMVRLDHIQVPEAFRGTGTSVALVRHVRTRWPKARLLGGPVSEDNPPGPRFRLRCWDEAGISIHEPNCCPGECACRELIRAEVAKRYRQWHESGGIAADQLQEKLCLLEEQPS